MKYIFFQSPTTGGIPFKIPQLMEEFKNNVGKIGGEGICGRVSKTRAKSKDTADDF
jgi:hypothetical protein